MDQVEMAEKIAVIEARLNLTDRRVSEMFAALDRQIAALDRQTRNVNRMMWVMTLTLLFAVVWGAVGDRGFNAVRRAAETAAPVAQCAGGENAQGS